MAFGRKRKVTPDAHAHARLRLTRSWHFPMSVIAYLDECTAADARAFDELVLRLDADPISHTRPTLDPAEPGFRCAWFGEHVLVLRFDPLAEPRGKIWCLRCVHL